MSLREPTQREHDMAARYRSGETLQQIGDSYGVTRERVRQLIGRVGLNGKDSGRIALSAIKKAIRRANRLGRLDARTQGSFGCTYSQLIELNLGRGPREGNALRYQTQRGCAGSRGIEWQLTFPEWLKIWSDSGHLAHRGRGKDMYAMARRGDVGPYSVANVYITTCADNVRDYQSELKRVGVVCPDGWVRLPEKSHIATGRSRTGHASNARGWTFRKSAKHANSPYQVVYRKKYIGSFPTAEAAHEAYLAAKQAG